MCITPGTRSGGPKPVVGVRPVKDLTKTVESPEVDPLRGNARRMKTVGVAVNGRYGNSSGAYDLTRR